MVTQTKIQAHKSSRPSRASDIALTHVTSHTCQNKIRVKRKARSSLARKLKNTELSMMADMLRIPEAAFTVNQFFFHLLMGDKGGSFCLVAFDEYIPESSDEAAKALRNFIGRRPNEELHGESSLKI